MNSFFFLWQLKWIVKNLKWAHLEIACMVYNTVTFHASLYRHRKRNSCPFFFKINVTITFVSMYRKYLEMSIIVVSFLYAKIIILKKEMKNKLSTTMWPREPSKSVYTQRGTWQSQNITSLVPTTIPNKTGQNR